MTLSNNTKRRESSITPDQQKLIEKYLEKKNVHHQKKLQHVTHTSTNVNLSSIKWKSLRLEDCGVSIPDSGLPAKIAYESIHDSLNLDGNPTLNLASFVNTGYINDYSEPLIHENLVKNLADNDEYPVMLELHERCLQMLTELWNGDSKKSIGSATTGSSEAIMLGGLAMKKNWQTKRRAAGKSTEKPNIIMASCCQVALEKFARYFEVDARIISCDNNDYILDYDLIYDACDENTIGIFVILGSTYTGAFEDVALVNKILDRVEKEKGFDIPIHVDGASGAFVAPFIYPDLEWDFRVPRVKSINTSGHKFGLVTAGLGWIVFKDKEWLPKDLVFELRYLGGLEYSFTLNFSRPGHQVIHQYFNFVALGKNGYSSIFDTCLTNARLLSSFLEETNYFKVVSNVHRPVEAGTTPHADDHLAFHPSLPVVSFQFYEEFSKQYPEIPQSIISTLMRNKGWIIPNYPLPRTTKPVKDDEREILRVVVRYNLTLELLQKLMSDIVSTLTVLTNSCKLIRESLNNDALEDTDIIYDMLLSIALDGSENLVKSSIKDHKHAGAC